MKKSIEQKWNKYEGWIKFAGLLLSWMFVIYLLIVHMDRDVWVLLVFILSVAATAAYTRKRCKRYITYGALALNKSEILKTSAFFYNPTEDICFPCQTPIGKATHYHLNCDCLIHKECYDNFNGNSGKTQSCPICQELITEINEYVYVYLDA